MEDRFRRIVVYVVLAVWAASFLMSLFVRSYKPPPEITSVMLAVLGLVGIAQVSSARRRDGGSGDGSQDDGSQDGSSGDGGGRGVSS